MAKQFLVFLMLLAFALPANALDLEVRKGRIVTLPKPAAHVFVANPDVADIDVRSPTYIYIYGVRPGETTVHALDSSNNTIYEETVTVSSNVTGLKKTINRVIPNSDVTIESLGNGVILRGTVDSPKDAETAVSIANAVMEQGGTLINTLQVRGSDQVMLKVKVAEVARTEIKSFGINLGALLTRGDFAFGLMTGRPFGALPNVLREGNNITVSDQIGRVDLDAVIDALETEGLVKTLAEPTLTAKSGESASFRAGGEYPIPVPQEDGIITIEYREFGVSLDFTPTVLSNDRISLQVAPEVSALTASVVTINDNDIPTLSTRSASTTVELGSGESFAVAGLLQNNFTTNVNKFPWLGDIPVLGALFKSNEFQKDETELVIIVTPYLVKGVKQPEKLLTPTDGISVPNDFERLLLGRLHETKWPAGRAGDETSENTIAKVKLNGDPGFIMEQ